MSYGYVPYAGTDVKVLDPQPSAGLPARQVDDNFIAIVDMAVAVAANVAIHAAATTTAHGGIVADSDARLSNARTPTAHKASHAVAGDDALSAADIAAIPATEKAAANGVATLGADSKVPAEQLPTLASYWSRTDTTLSPLNPGDNVVTSGTVSGALSTRNLTFAVVNGTFAADTNWTKGTGWTIASGVATHSGSTGANLAPAVALAPVAGRSYKVAITVTARSGNTNTTISLGGNSSPSLTAAATYTYWWTASSTAALNIAAAGTVGTISIDNVAVEEYLPSTLGPLTVLSTLSLGDDAAIVFGDGTDARLYSDGTNLTLRLPSATTSPRITFGTIATAGNDYPLIQFPDTYGFATIAGTLWLKQADYDPSIALTGNFPTDSDGLNIGVSDATSEAYIATAGTGWGLKIATAASQKLGLWGTAPDAQPTTAIAGAAFAANSGTAVNDASTFGGYTIKQVVAALQRIGALA